MSLFPGSEESKNKLVSEARARVESRMDIIQTGIDRIFDGQLDLQIYSRAAESVGLAAESATPQDKAFNPKTGEYQIEIRFDRQRIFGISRFRPLDFISAQPEHIQWSFQGIELGKIGYIWMNITMKEKGREHKVSVQVAVASKKDNKWILDSKLNTVWKSLEQQLVCEALDGADDNWALMLAPFETTVDQNKEIVLDSKGMYRISVQDVPNAEPGQRLVVFPQLYKDRQVIVTIFQKQDTHFERVLEYILVDGIKKRVRKLVQDEVEIFNLVNFQLKQIPYAHFYKWSYQKAENIRDEIGLTEQVMRSSFIQSFFLQSLRRHLQRVNNSYDIPPHTFLHSHRDLTTRFRWIELYTQEPGSLHKKVVTMFMLKETPDNPYNLYFQPWCGLAQEAIVRFMKGEDFPRYIDGIQFRSQKNNATLKVAETNTGESLALDISALNFPETQEGDLFDLRPISPNKDTVQIDVFVNGVFRAVCTLSRGTNKVILSKEIPLPVPAEVLSVIVILSEQGLAYDSPIRILPLTVGTNTHAIRIGSIDKKSITLPIRPYMNLQPGERLQLLVGQQTVAYTIFDLRRIGGEPFASYNFYPGEKVFKIREDEDRGVQEVASVGGIIQGAARIKNLLDLTRPDGNPDD